jgi:hypothetical protein
MEGDQGILSFTRTCVRSLTCKSKKHGCPSLAISNRKNGTQFSGKNTNKVLTARGKITNIYFTFCNPTYRKCSCPFRLELEGSISIMTIKQVLLFGFNED